jgi:hypothetical protein
MTVHPPQKHNSKVLQGLEELRLDEAKMLEFGKKLTQSGGRAMFPLDLLAFAAIKRNLSTTAALVTLIEAHNMLAARSMLRVHLDSSLRFAAAWFVDDPQGFAAKVNAGERIDKLKDREGKPLKDARLVELLTPDHPWLPEVYKRLSGYVHLSDSHLTGTVIAVDDEAQTVSFFLGKTDDHYPAQSWLEIMDCAQEGTEILAYYLAGYIQTKNTSPEELAAMRQAFKTGKK